MKTKIKRVAQRIPKQALKRKSGVSKDFQKKLKEFVRDCSECYAKPLLERFKRAMLKKGGKVPRNWASFQGPWKKKLDVMYNDQFKSATKHALRFYRTPTSSPAHGGFSKNEEYLK